jgi:hypothetical protein
MVLPGTAMKSFVGLLHSRPGRGAYSEPLSDLTKQIIELFIGLGVRLVTLKLLRLSQASHCHHVGGRPQQFTDDPKGRTRGHGTIADSSDLYAPRFSTFIVHTRSIVPSDRRV